MGDNYYRLKYYLKDGGEIYSEVRAVNFGIDLAAISFFPNPAQDELYINLSEYAGQEGSLTLSNKYGQILQTMDMQEIPSDPIKVDVSKYTNGLYFVRTKIARSKIASQKVFISKMY